MPISNSYTMLKSIVLEVKMLFKTKICWTCVIWMNFFQKKILTATSTTVPNPQYRNNWKKQQQARKYAGYHVI